MQGQADAETGDVGRNVREPALVGAAREIDVDPGNAILDEALEETRGQDVVGRGVLGALFDIGDRALQRLVVVGIEREGPDPFAALAAGLDEHRVNGGLHLAAVTTRYWGQGLAMMS